MGIKRTLLFCLFLFLSLQLWAQQEFARHTVQQGETVYSIAKQYQIDESVLEKYNPDIKNGLKEGTILIIPKVFQQKSKVVNQEEYFLYTVQAKETLYGLSKRFHCTVEEMVALNPHIKDGLKEDEVIKIPKRTAPASPVSEPRDSNKYYYHIVEQKETVFSICKAAGITEDEFLKLNPHVRENGLKIGQTIRVPKEKVKPKEELPTDIPSKKEQFGIYRVMPGDDIAKIAAKYNTTIEVLIELNPELIKGAVPGRYIVVPKKKVATRPATNIFTSQVFWNIPTEENRPKIHFAVLVPLYLWDYETRKMEAMDEEVAVSEKSKIGLQFLAGVQVAMDTLAGIGYDVQLDIYDTRNDEKQVRRICREIDRSVDVIIGPLFAKNLEIVSAVLPDVPVVSPLSKAVENEEKGNLINCMPTLNTEYREIAYWINEKKSNANIVFVNTSTAENHAAVKEVNKFLFAADSTGHSEIWVDETFSQLNQLNGSLDLKRENVLIVVDQDAAFVSDLLTRINNRRDSIVFLIGTSKFLEINTLENRYLNNQPVMAIHPYNVDYTDTLTQLFIKDYRKITATEPTKFGMSGFDIAMYFGQLIGAYGHLPEVNIWPQIKGVFRGFQFSKLDGSGPQNNFVYKLCVRDYELRESAQ